jgi:predicted GNAT family acetyltransferase
MIFLYTLFMNIIVYDKPKEFLPAAQDFLEREEVLNAVILGVVQRMIDDPEHFDHGAYLAIIRNKQDEIVLVAMMDPPHPLTLASGNECPDETLNLLAESIKESKRPLPSVHGPVPLAERFAPIWASKNDLAFELEMGQGVYELREVTSPVKVAGKLVMAQTKDLDLISEWMLGFERDAFGENKSTLEEMKEAVGHRIQKEEWYIWKDGEIPLSIVMRSRPTRHGICVTGVYTPPELRGRGYASASVAAFSQKLLDEGFEFTSLFTDLANPTSNKIYMNVGYQHVSDFNKYKFIEK